MTAAAQMMKMMASECFMYGSVRTVPVMVCDLGGGQLPWPVSHYRYRYDSSTDYSGGVNVS